MQRILVIGTGHIGRDCAARLQKLAPQFDVLLIGNEIAYDRTKLANVIDGTCRAADLVENTCCPVILGAVTRIDRAGKYVVFDGNRIRYDYLVLATGGTPVILRDSPVGVVCLRTLGDAEAIVQGAAAAKNIVVIGGGTLGVETAVAVRGNYPHLNVTILHGGATLLERMLDDAASRVFVNLLQKDGINVCLDAQVDGFITRTNEFAPVERVAGLILKNGGVVAADLVISAIGVRANDKLARDSGLPCDNGVIVDGDCRTEDPSIFAVGDCVNNSPRNLLTGFQQAEVAARAIAGKKSVPVAQKATQNRLKTHHKAYSVGVFEAAKTITYRRPHAFRKLFLDADNRLVGAVVFGGWSELPAIEQAVLKGETLSPVRQLSFKHFGMTSTAQPKPQNWADDAVICQCKQVTKGQIVAAAKQGATVEQVSQATGAGTGCGGCKPLIAQLLNVRPAPIKNARPMGAIALAATVLALLLIAFSIPYPEHFGNPLRALWADDLAKQITGYTVLALAAGLAAIGIRKRVKATPYDAWKLVHVALGLCVLFALVAHSGGRFGAGLTLGLTTSFVGTALTGALLALVFAKSHKLDAGTQTQARKALHWLHVLFLWPLPVLLGFHIATFYLWS